MIAGLILAAGESSRMGSDKALLTYRGRTFLETILANLRDADIAEVAVVLGHHAQEIQNSVDLRGTRVVINRDYQAGQTSSLQTGLAALEGTSPEAVVLCLVDHPTVSSDVIAKLCDHFQLGKFKVIVPTYQGQKGHPVIIGKALFPELLALGHDQGANSVIRQYRTATRFVEVDDPGILVDVDDPETYLRLEA